MGSIKNANPIADITHSILALEQLEADIGAMDFTSGSVHFMCYDIDALRQINYAYGRKVGDALLGHIARWIRATYPGVLYRVEGDMFCCLLRGYTHEKIMEFAQDAFLQTQNIWTLDFGGQKMELCATASFCVIEADESVISQNLIDLFERTLSIAKYRQSVSVYNPETDRTACRHFRLRMDLKNHVLLHMRGFSLHYQPIVDPVHGVWKGLEALCRWSSSVFGPVPPNVFIPELEQMGLMPPFGLWVLETAISEAVELQLDQIEDFFLSVNVSCSQVAQYDFCDRLVAIIEKYKFPFYKLNLEITESCEFTFNEQMKETIQTLRELGISMALDDFGTGYSNLSNLKKLPATYIKTDRDFISQIESDRFVSYLLYVVSAAAHVNGMRLIAEGIETKEQLQLVMMNGADLVQGYLFSKPVPLGEIKKRIHYFYVSQSRLKIRPSHYKALSFHEWIEQQSSLAVTPAFFDLVNQCLNIVLNENDPASTFEQILAAVGLYFKIQHMYVFLKNEGTIFSNKYEWCASGAFGHKEFLQHIDMSLDGIYERLLNQDFIIANEPSHLPTHLFSLLKENGIANSIKSLIAAPIISKGELIGCIGFDDNTRREWATEELLITHFLRLLALLVLGEEDKLSLSS